MVLYLSIEKQPVAVDSQCWVVNESMSSFELIPTRSFEFK